MIILCEQHQLDVSNCDEDTNLYFIVWHFSVAEFEEMTRRGVNFGSRSPSIELMRVLEYKKIVAYAL